MSKAAEPESRPFALRAIYLREGKQWLADSFDPATPGQPLTGQFRTSGIQVQINEAQALDVDLAPIRTCRMTSNFEFRYLNVVSEELTNNEIDDKFLVATISASISVDYSIQTPDIPSEETLQKWAQSNSMLHCWPYWREFCHSTLLRMNLPITLMPMIDAKTAPPK